MKVECQKCWTECDFDNKNPKKKIKCLNCGNNFSINDVSNFQTPENKRIHKTIWGIWS